jgi:hypothetical protein
MSQDQSEKTKTGQTAKDLLGFPIRLETIRMDTEQNFSVETIMKISDPAAVVVNDKVSSTLMH